MVDNCANPRCAKPLHLWEGRVVVFDMADHMNGLNGSHWRRVEHYWLCGSCSQTMSLEQNAEGVHLLVRAAVRMPNAAA